MSRLSLARPFVLGAILATTTTFGCGDHTRVTAPRAKEVGMKPIAAPEPSRLVSCTSTWIAAVSGSWADATKWSTNAVPTASDDVCITANGTYTVTVTGVRVANTVTVGSPDNTANPVLNVAGTGTGSSLTAATGLVNEGTITMTWAGGTNGTVSMVAVTDGAFENRGSLQVMSDGIGAPRAIRANLVNHGTVSIATLTTFDKANAVYENRGSFTVTGGGINMVSGLGQRFLQSAGTIAVNSGSFSVNAESFDFQGGNITGAVTLTGGTLIIGPDATGTAQFNVRAASTLVGNIGANTLVRVIGINTGSTLTSATGFTNAGAIDLLWGSGTNGTHATIAVTEGTLTNTGTIRSLTDGIAAPRFIRASVVNEGTVSIEHPTSLDKAGAVYENRGAWNVTSTMSMTTGVTQRFVQSAGVLTVTGGFVVTKERFDHNGGVITGAVTLTDAALNIGEGSTGAAIFNVRGASTLSGDVAAAQTIRIQGIGTGSTLTSATGFTNAGTIEQSWAGGTNGTHATLAVTSGVLTNTGTIRTLPDGIAAPRVIAASLVNEGSIHIGQLTTFNKAGATYDNRGTFTLAGAVNITSAAGQTFRQSAGTLGGTGTLTMTGGTLEAAGGTLTANAVLSDGLLRFAPGASGTGKVVVRGTAATLAGDIPAGWSVHVSTAGTPSTSLVAAEGFTNHGLIEMAPLGGGSNNGTGVIITVANGTFRNTGTLRVNNDPFGGTTRTISAAEFVNEGTIDIRSRTLLERANGIFRNNGTISFNGNTTLTMTGLGQTFITTGQVTGPAVGSLNLGSLTFMGSGSLAANLNLTSVNAHIGTSGAAALIVTGAYRMITGGSLNVDLGNDPTPGTGHDRLTVTGTATLLGTLNVTPIAGTCIDPNQTFEIMGYTARSGDFTTKNGLNLGGGRTLTAQANATNYRLVSNGTPCVAPDDTPPVITPSVVGALGDNDWYISDVTVSWNVSDAESEVTSREGCESTTLTTDHAGTTYTCSATSNGGTASRSVTVKRDATPPSVNAVRFPAANEYGWNNVDVTAQFTATDAMSGLQGSATVEKVFSSEGANQAGAHDFRDNAGNVRQAFVLGISIDKTAPTWYESRRIPALPASGWHNTAVLSEVTGSDALSGLANLAVVGHTVSNEGMNVGWQNGFADKAGNGVVAQVLMNIDMTPPVITVTRSPLPDASGWNNTSVTVTYSATDALSGVAGASTFQQLFDGDGANQSGSHSFTDVAGNTATGTVSGINIDRTTLEVSCSATPEEIWPANNKMVPVRVTITGTGIVRYALRSVTNNETGAADAAGWAIGTADLEGTVMASRLGQGNGRTYTLTYDVFGSRGSSTCSVTVRVPHDRRK